MRCAAERHRRCLCRFLTQRWLLSLMRCAMDRTARWTARRLEDRRPSPQKQQRRQLQICQR